MLNLYKNKDVHDKNHAVYPIYLQNKKPIKIIDNKKKLFQIWKSS